MDGINWIDVRGQIPQPLQAHDAVHGARQVAARLWHTPAADRPYKVECRLIEDGSAIDTWEQNYTAPAITSAHRAYDDLRYRGQRWLGGEDLKAVRPHFSKGNH
jgi:hypothetical protein